MSETNPGSGRDPVEQMLESFLARWRRGERPGLEEYAARCPERADEIRELFPAMIEMEQLKPAVELATGSLERPSPRPESSARPEPSHPERLGNYRILRVIGEGGMGIVYEAVHESLKKPVALKVMHKHFRDDKTYLERFRREARSVAGLQHTNIVPVFDFGEHDGILFYAMQYIPGFGLDRVLDDVRRLRAEAGAAAPAPADVPGDLSATEASADPVSAVTRGLLTGRFAAAPDTPAEWDPPPTQALGNGPTESLGFQIPDNSPRSSPSAVENRTSASVYSGKSELAYFREVARLGAQVADALDYAHHHKPKVVHRDIKPSNLLLDALGNVWVTDFGLAKLVEGDGSESRDVAGTLRFMAPERFQGVTDPRCDIYALGATLYEMLTLRPAFSEQDQVKLIRQIADEPPKSLCQHDPRIPRDLETIVHKVLAKDPNDRCDKAGELRDELRRFLEGRPTRWRRVGPVEQFRRWCKRNPWLAAANITTAVLTTTLAIVSTIAAWIYRDQRNTLEIERGKTQANLIRAQKAEQTANERLAQTQKAEERARVELHNYAWQLATGVRDPERAIELALKVFAQEPDTNIYLNTLGVARYRVGDYAKAVATLEKSLATGEGGTEPWDLFFLAMARFKLGDITRARADFDRAVKLRRDLADEPAQVYAELDAFQAEAQALLDGPPTELPADVFALSHW